jgi:secondary thiamine-phosphate synthase enzyme
MQFVIRSAGHTDYHDITARVEAAVREASVRDGIACAFVAGTTVGMTIMDDEEGLKRDFRHTVEQLAPENGSYEHNTPGDENGYAHIRSMLLGPSVSVPVVDGGLVLGRWQKNLCGGFRLAPPRAHRDGERGRRVTRAEAA